MKLYREPKKYNNCPNCGAATHYPELWRDAFCDETCHESYLEKRKVYYDRKNTTSRTKKYIQ